jgi:hypothetical protein
VRCGDVVLLVADSRAGGVPEDGRESGGAADLRDATALVEPVAVQPMGVQPVAVQPVVVDLETSRRPVG